MAAAEVVVGEGEPPGLARQRRPRFRPSEAPTTGDMAGSGEGEGKPPHVYVLSLPAMAPPPAPPLAVVVSHLDAAVPVPRRPRSYLPRSVPMGWWAFRLPVLPRPPPPPPPPPPVAAAAPEKRPPKRARRCLNCDAVETPQWRSGPMGKSTLCNACGVRLRAAGSLLDCRRPPPPPAAATPVSPPDSPIWTPPQPHPKSPPGDIYLVRKIPPKLVSRRAPNNKQQQQPPPPPAPVPAPKTKAKKPKKKKGKRKKTCFHCGSSETPQWREGPMGRGTLCNACGVRHRQGRLLPEYRPKGSPTFMPAVHAANHRQVLELRRQHHHHRHHNNDDRSTTTVNEQQQQQQVDPPPQEEAVAGGGGGGETASLDALLLDGPSAPLIVDGDDDVLVS